ncbi:uncharacterized protein DDB_G0271670-like [Strongylocentrotus purpuratus]|uniref:Myb/SANT-like DNA-binding domain-containing protein n=1 Tax=Strongylocentrotus purpuratus TaxID=7668 RepID=A0A7M7PD52_STRPU|nr:uncharacterized protein DDB_G0271670-like [Strongylocentrotus purpuratus]
MAESSKKQRRANWEVTEKHYLLELIVESVEVIENKKNDYEANVAKNDEWSRIHLMFQARYRRELKELKEQWKRMKLVAKNEWSVWSSGRRLTGGGPAPKSPSAITTFIHNLIPQDFRQIKNSFDCDAEITVNNEEAVTALRYLAGERQEFTCSSFGMDGIESNRDMTLLQLNDPTDDPIITHPSTSTSSSSNPSTSSLQPSKHSTSISHRSQASTSSSTTHTPLPTDRTKRSRTNTPPLAAQASTSSLQPSRHLFQASTSSSNTHTPLSADRTNRSRTNTPPLAAQASTSSLQPSRHLFQASTSSSNTHTPLSADRTKRPRTRTPSPAPNPSLSFDASLLEFAQKEHDLKIQHLNREHEKRMEILELEQRFHSKKLELLEL